VNKFIIQIIWVPFVAPAMFARWIIEKSEKIINWYGDTVLERLSAFLKKKLGDQNES